MGIYCSEAWILFKQWQVEMFMQEQDLEEPDPFGDNFPAENDNIPVANVQDTANYN